jgi:hypothetical protein
MNIPSTFCNLTEVLKSVDQSEFVHHLQRRGMHGVAAEIAKEVACFSSTTTSIRASNRYPSIMPAGPPPTMQQRTCMVLEGGGSEKVPVSMIQLSSVVRP